MLRFGTVTFPPVIELVPPSAPVRSEVVVPGSKSITNRALVLAALSSGRTTLRGALWSEDTAMMVGCLAALGVEVSVAPDAREPGNRTIAVAGRGGDFAPGGAADRPLELFVGNAGTAARFVTALVCLGRGSYRVSGSPRMHERPQAALFEALRELGYSIDSPNGKLPAVVHGAGPRPGAQCRVRIGESSQFASALLLASARGGWKVAVEGQDEEESSYVKLTAHVMDSFPTQGGTFQIEPDASSASYMWGADWILRRRPATRTSTISVADWPNASPQIDARFPGVLETFPPRLSRLRDLGDSIMTAIVLAPFADSPKAFVDLGRLRLQESERVQALRTELTKCGAAVVEDGDSLRIAPGPLHGAEIETYDDHRIAMSFALLGLSVEGIRIRNPECVRKTFPNFFEKLAQPPPDGLGVRVRAARA